ncbi:unnamed protein product [Rotaria sp. Silwood2]|nr:unnamed protein product [Rotaria sp. Silwood2]
MLIGRTRTGKSTIKALLVDPTKIPDEIMLKSGTREPLFESFHSLQNNIVFNIIDTPGLFERGPKDEMTIRDNETILKTISMCVNMEITKFHVICFCMSLTSGINQEDIKSLELLVDFLGKELSDNSCLIITHCESKTKEQLNALRKELVEDMFFKNIASFFKLGIFFSGSLNRDDYNHGNENLLDQFVTISEYREELIKLFTSEIKTYPICKMLFNRSSHVADIQKQREKEANERTEEQQRLIDQLTTIQANDQAQVKEIVQRYRESVRREEKARAESKYYMDSYENLLRYVEKKTND